MREVVVAATVLVLLAVVAPRVHSAPTRAISSTPPHKKAVFEAVRKYAFRAAPTPDPEAPESSVVNCHEASLHGYTERVKADNPPDRPHPKFDALPYVDPEGDEWQTPNQTLRYCYFSFVSDNFTKLGSPARPTLAFPQYRGSLLTKDDFEMFGHNEGSHATDACLNWGSTKNPHFVDTQGYAVYPVKERPFFTMKGRFFPRFVSRALDERQRVTWKIVFNSWGDDTDNVFQLASGSFVVQRKSEEETTGVVLEGDVELPPVSLMGFENGWVGVYVKVEFVHGTSAADTGLFSLCDDFITFNFVEPADPAQYSLSTVKAKNESSWFRAFAPSSSFAPLGEAPISASVEAVASFDFSSGKLDAQRTGRIEDIGKSCEGKEATFERAFLNGKSRTVLRFQEGTGLTLTGVDTLINTGEFTSFSVAMMVKMERTDCYVRILNVNPAQDNGVYYCNGVQLTPEAPAGSQLAALSWHHLVITTHHDRRTKIYIDGVLEKSWVVGRANWKGGIMVKGAQLNLFNDCGAECACDSGENSGGWIAGLRLFNYPLSDAQAYADFMSYVGGGWVANYDLSTRSLASMDPIINGPYLQDIGRTCGHANGFVRDTVSNTNSSVLSVQKGTGVLVDLATLGMETGAASAYTIIAKLKFDSVGDDAKYRRVFNTNGGEDRGLYLRNGHFVLFPESDSDVGLGLRPVRAGVYYTIALSTGPDRTTRLYVDGQLTREWKPAQDVWTAGLALTSPYISVLNDAGNECQVNPIADTENTGGKLRALMLFKGVLEGSDVMQYTQMMGSEAVLTADPERAGGGAVPVNTPCTFPFTLDGEAYFACTTKNSAPDKPWCSTTKSYSGNSWGYCAEGAGYVAHHGASVAPGNTIGDCKGIAGCQRECNAKFECVGFVMPDPKRGGGGDVGDVGDGGDVGGGGDARVGQLKSALELIAAVGGADGTLYTKAHVAPVVELVPSRGTLDMTIANAPLGMGTERAGAVTQATDIGAKCNSRGAFADAVVAVGAYAYPAEWKTLVAATNPQTRVTASTLASACNGAAFKDANSRFRLRVTMGNATDYFMGTNGASLCDVVKSSSKHVWAPAEDQTYVQPEYLDAHFGGSKAWWPSDGRKYLSFWGSDSAGVAGGCCHTGYGDEPGWQRAFELAAKWPAYQTHSSKVWSAPRGTGILFANAGDLMPSGDLSAYTVVVHAKFESLAADACAHVWGVGALPSSGALFACSQLKLVLAGSGDDGDDGDDGNGNSVHRGFQTLTAGQWYVVAMSTAPPPSGRTVVYLDGTKQFEVAPSAAAWREGLSLAHGYFSLFNNGGEAAACRAADTATHSRVEVSKALVYDRPLSEAEVRDVSRMLVLGCPATAAGECDGHGACSRGVCQCEAGRKGTDCATRMCPGTPECNGRGKCVDGECQCYQPEDKALPQYRGTAPTGEGNDCSVVKCPGESFVDGAYQPCSGHGYCVAGQCQCQPGFRGTAAAGWGNDCSVRACPGDYFDGTAFVECSGHGKCDRGGGGSGGSGGACLCAEGWTGEDCATAGASSQQIALADTELGRHVFWHHGEDGMPSFTRTPEGFCRLTGTMRVHNAFWGVGAQAIGATVIHAETREYDGRQTWQTPNVRTGLGSNFDADFSITAMVRTTASEGVLVAKYIPNYDWGYQGKVFFFRGGHLAYDVGYVGAVDGSRTINDGKWHCVAMQYTKGSSTVDFFVDGAHDRQAQLASQGDPNGSEMMVGYNSPSFVAPFRGELKGVRFYQGRQVHSCSGGVVGFVQQGCQPDRRLIFPTSNGGRLDIETSGRVSWLYDVPEEDGFYVTELNHVLYMPSMPATAGVAALSLSPNWQAYGHGYGVPAVSYVGGLCIASGLARAANGNAADAARRTLGTVSEPCRAQSLLFIVVSGDRATRVDLTGGVSLAVAIDAAHSINMGPRGDWVSLDGIYWHAGEAAGLSTGRAVLDAVQSPHGPFALSKAWKPRSGFAPPQLFTTSSSCFLSGFVDRSNLEYSAVLGTLPPACAPRGPSGLVSTGQVLVRMPTDMEPTSVHVDLDGKVFLGSAAESSPSRWVALNSLVFDNRACLVARFSFRNARPGSLAFTSESPSPQCFPYKLLLLDAAASKFAFDPFCGAGTAALAFDGTAGAGAFAQGLHLNAASFTFAAWVKLATLSRDMVLFSYGDDQSAWCELGLAPGGPGNIRCSMGNEAAATGGGGGAGAAPLATVSSQGGLWKDGFVNTWHHVAIVRDAGAREVRFFLDFAPVGAAPFAGTNDGALKFSSKGFYLGLQPASPTKAFHGSMMDVLVNKEAAVRASSVASTTECELLCATCLFDFNSLDNGATGTVSSTLDGEAGCTPYDASLPSTNANADAGGGGGGGGVTPVRDLPCKGVAALFDGAPSTAVEVPRLRLDTESFTVAMWVRPDTVSHDMTLFSYGHRAVEPSVLCQLRLKHPARDVHCEICDAAWSPASGQACTAVNSARVGWDEGAVGVWVHVAVVRDAKAAQVRFFVNGAPRGTVAFAGSNVKAPRVSKGGFRLGAVGHREDVHANFEGAMGEVKVYRSRALAQGWAACEGAYNDGAVAHYTFDERSGRDYSGGGNDLVVSGGALFEPTRLPLGVALALDGSGAVAAKSAPVLTGVGPAVTLACWVRVRERVPWAAFVGGFSGKAGVGFSLGLDGDEGGSLMYAFDTGKATGWAGRAVAPGTLALDRWTHVVAAADASSVEFFVDGKSLGSRPAAAPSAAVSELVVGLFPAFDAFFKGDLAEVEVYTSRLSAGDVADLYDDAGMQEHQGTGEGDGEGEGSTVAEEGGAEGAGEQSVAPCTSNYFSWSDARDGASESRATGPTGQACEGLTAVLGGGASFTTDTYCGTRGVRLDGASEESVVRVPGLALDVGTLTFSAWVRVDTMARSHVLFSYGGGGGGAADPSVSCQIDRASKRLSCRMCDDSWTSGECALAESEEVGWGPDDVGVWRHVAVVRDASAQAVSFFVDGEQYGRAKFAGANVGALRRTVAPPVVLLGALPGAEGAGSRFVGTMSEVAVLLDRAVHAPEVADALLKCSGQDGLKATVNVAADASAGVALALPKRGHYCLSVTGEATSRAGGPNPDCDGTAGPLGMPECGVQNFGHPHLGLVASVGRPCTSPSSTCGVFVGEGTTVFADAPTTLHLVVADDVYSDNSGGFVVVVQNCSESQGVSDAPVLLYGFENTLRDSSRNGNDLAALKGAAAFEPSRSTSLGYALRLDGKSYFVTVPSRPPTEEVSVVAWVKLAQRTPRAALAEMYASAEAVSWSVRLDDEGKRLAFLPRSTAAAGWLPAARGASELPLGAWVHVAVTYDGDEVRFFVGGKPDGTAKRLPGAPIATDGSLIVGAAPAHSGAVLSGALARLAVFDRALLPAEVLEDFDLAASAAAGGADSMVRRSNARGRVGTACEGEQLHLSCEEGMVLSVGLAHYGRVAPNVCSAVGSATDVSCASEGVTASVAERCNLKRSCVLEAASSVYGSPCGNQATYLTVEYSCVFAEEKCHGAYFRGPTPLTFAAAQDYCTAHGGRLAVVDTPEKGKQLEQFCDNDCGWLGARCDDNIAMCANDGNGAHWYWQDEDKKRLDKVASTYNAWQDGAGPRGAAGMEQQCARYASGGKWASDVCQDNERLLTDVASMSNFGYWTSHGVGGCVSCIADQHPMTTSNGWEQHGFNMHCGGDWCFVYVDMREDFVVTKFAVSGYAGGSHKPNGNWYLQASHDNNGYAYWERGGWRTIGTASASQWKSGYQYTASYPFEDFQIRAVDSPSPYRYYRIGTAGFTNNHMLIENLGLWGYKKQRVHRPVCERVGQPFCEVKHKASVYTDTKVNKECYLVAAEYRGTTNTWDGSNLCLSWARSGRTPAANPLADLDGNYCRSPDGDGRPWCFDLAGNKRVCETVPPCTVDTRGFVAEAANYPGNDISSHGSVSLTWCTDACRGNQNCNGFTYSPSTSQCWLKTHMVNRIDDAGLVSGVLRDQDSLDMLGWCGPDGAALRAGTAYPACVGECAGDPECAAVRWTVDTLACSLLRQCTGVNGDERWRHRVVPHHTPCADVNCNHGRCVEAGKGDAVCACDDGFKGRFCEYQAWSAAWSGDTAGGANCMTVGFHGAGFPGYKNVDNSYLKVIATLSHRNYNRTSGGTLRDDASAHDIVGSWVEEVTADRFRVCFRDASHYGARTSHKDLFVEWFATDLDSVFGGAGQVGVHSVNADAWQGASTRCEALRFRQPFARKPVLVTTANRKNAIPITKGTTAGPSGSAFVHWVEYFVKKGSFFVGALACVADFGAESNHAHGGTYVDWLAFDQYDVGLEADGVVSGSASTGGGGLSWTWQSPLKTRLAFSPGFDGVRPTSVIAQVNHNGQSSVHDRNVMWLENVETTHAFAGFGEDSDLGHAGPVVFDFVAFR